MIITHASATKIETVKSYRSYENDVYRGCLFFGSEDNDYNLACDVKFKYNLEVNEDKVIRVSRFFYEHSHEESIVAEVLNDLRDELGLECDDEEMSEIIDETNDIYEYVTTVDSGNASWLVQQYQGILAHKLGYDCAVAFDEQGVVYIAYCVGRELEEVAL